MIKDFKSNESISLVIKYIALLYWIFKSGFCNLKSNHSKFEID
jgi:hypothetical protein